MNPRRRAWLAALSGGVAWAQGLAGGAAAQAAPATTPTAPASPADPVRRGRALVFPRDHGAHPGSRIEWWYATGWLLPAGPGDDPNATAATPASAATAGLVGFQLTFFRARTGLAAHLPGRFAPRQLLFAHAAITEVAGARHRHADRVARWAGRDEPGLRDNASLADARIAIGPWRLDRQDGGAPRESGATPPAAWTSRIEGRNFAFSLQLTRTQPVLLQGEAGFSTKGPQDPGAAPPASHYYSEPQLAAGGTLVVDGRSRAVRGRAWLDHEWSDQLLHPQAVGWDWIGINLDDGSALTAFRLRRADGSTLWAGGSLRRVGDATPRVFDPQEVAFTPGRVWASPVSGARYPVEWQVRTPAGALGVYALMDAQEVDSRASTGTVYWEGLSGLRDAQGRPLGLGYLEMTGYAGRLVL